MAANAEITFDAGDGDFWDKRWTKDFTNSVVHFKKHPSNVANGATSAPWVLFFHGGGGTSRDGRLPFILDAAGNEVFSGLLARTGAADTHFNVLSVTLPQVAFNGQVLDSVYTATAGTKQNGGFRRSDTLGNAHSQTGTLRWNFPREAEKMLHPMLWTYTQLFICWWKSVCAAYGCDPDKGFVMGSSIGGVRAMLSQCHVPLNTNDLAIKTRNYYGLKPNVDSTVLGVINKQGPPDWRRSPAYVLERGFAAGTYVIPGATTARFFPIFPTKANLDRIPDEALEQMSALWFYEDPSRLGNKVPMYQFWEREGNVGGGTNNGGTPGNEVTYPVPGAVSHDESQLFQWMRTIRNVGLQGYSREILALATWSTDEAELYAGGFEGQALTYQEVIHLDTYRWLTGILGEGPSLSGKGPLWYALRVADGGTKVIPAGVGYTSASNGVDTPF